MNLKGRHFLKLMDYTPEEITYLIDLAAELKAKKKNGIRHDDLVGKNIALIFEKTSTRTRCSFEVAAHDLGMHVTYLDPSGSQIGRRRASRIQRGCLDVCLMESSTVDMVRKSWMSWQNMQEYLYGMVLPMSSIQHR